MRFEQCDFTVHVDCVNKLYCKFWSQSANGPLAFLALMHCGNIKSVALFPPQRKDLV